MENYYSASEAMQRMFGIDFGTFEEWFTGKPNVIIKEGTWFVHKDTFRQVFQEHRAEIMTKPVVKTYHSNKDLY